MITNGIDLVEIERIEQSIKNPRFLTRVFSDEERRLFAQRKNSLQTIAANFAGKEAFAKSLGCGVRGFSLTEVEILRNEMGAPWIRLSGKAKERAGDCQFCISLTHTKHYAAATVLCEHKE